MSVPLPVLKVIREGRKVNKEFLTDTSLSNLGGTSTTVPFGTRPSGSIRTKTTLQALTFAGPRRGRSIGTP